MAPGLIEPIRPSPDLWYYRNKMEFAFGNPSPSEPQVIELGLHKPKRLWDIVDVTACDIVSPEAGKLLGAARAWARGRNLSAYNSRRETGVLRHLVIREGKNTGERLVNFISTSGLKNAEGFLEALSGTGARLDTVLWSRTDGVADVAQGETAAILLGNGWIKERIGRVEFKVTPYGFMQTNTRAAEEMVKTLREWAGTSHGALIDVYCGSGLLGLSLADRFGSVAGLELNPVSIEAARENALFNQIKNADFICAKAEEALPKIIGATDPAGSLTVVVDPPRAGLHKNVINALIAAKAQVLIYVSCNPASLAADFRVLSPYYSVDRIQPMDFYPHTPHLESMALLRSRE